MSISTAKFGITILSAAVILFSNAALAEQENDPRQILFVGNSYLYYNDSLHNHVNRLAQEGQQLDKTDLRYRSITISGGSIAHHPIKHYLTPGAVGYQTPFDVVILQGNSGAATTDQRKDSFREAVLAADALIKEHGGQTALYMTHAYAEGHEDYDPEGTDKLVELYTSVAAEIDATVIPVGLAFAEAKRARPDIELHMEFDHSHPNLLGSYLAAATVYAALYGSSPEGLSYDYFGRIDADTIAFLQSIAADTVSSFHSQD